MSENSKIEWTDSTFNPWEGCQKVGPGCDHCYAEARNARFSGGTAANWGPGAPRRRTSAANWRKPLAWNARPFLLCRACGWRGDRPGSVNGLAVCPEVRCASIDLMFARRRVFCASLADVFDNAVEPAWRRDLFALIASTPNLDWLLLTKRIGNVAAMLREIGVDRMPDNLWLGATIVNQAEADRDIPKLLAVPARVRFLSMEPLLGPVDLMKWLDPFTCGDCGFHGSECDAGPDGCDACGESFGSGDTCQSCGTDDQSAKRSCPRCGSHRSFERDAGYIFDNERKLIDWVIAGGESGPGARPMHPDWDRSLRDQCAAAGVPFLFKQWGEWMPAEHEGDRVTLRFASADATGPKQPDWFEWPDKQVSAKVGKKAAGRLLDGRTHDEFPEAR